MSWHEIGRKWRPVAGWWTVVALAAACGGGSDGGTGPGNQLLGSYQLVGANDDPVPVVVTSDACAPVPILGGGMALRGDGTWEMTLNWRDATNTARVLQDHGRFQQADDQLAFRSEAYGDQFEGEVDDGVVWFYYDFCVLSPGEDLDLAFTR